MSLLTYTEITDLVTERVIEGSDFSMINAAVTARASSILRRKKGRALRSPYGAILGGMDRC